MIGKPLHELIGQECDQVWFVRDYVQIWFSDWGLSCFAPPTVARHEVEVRFPAPGSRDALCSLIGGVVQSAGLGSDDTVEVRFTDGAFLRLEVDLEHPDWEVWDLVRRTW